MFKGIVTAFSAVLLLIFSVLAGRLAEKSISDVTYLVSSWMLNLIND